ncbi:MAG: FAD-binding protein [Desulfovibrio sp.]|nr:FAD-binding protein [Desulfovibrio sp.]MBI4960378.1 FAD-binding protein [Desulfovibrio sp.]
MLPASTDVLVLGAGLAGLRAALSCLQSAPGLTVTVVSLLPGPSGSSFANQNDALGIHACLNDREREAYAREVLSLNRGAWLSLPLLTLQAEESEARLQDLIALGMPFANDSSGALSPRSSCFSPESRRAYIFSPLSKAYDCFITKLNSLGCRFAHHWLPAAILGNPVNGALFVPAVGGEPTTVSAKAVVVALGGPARLFKHSMAGPGVPGYGHGLLARAGAEMKNLGFLQYMWGTVPGKSFWQPAAMAGGGYGIVNPDGRTIRPEDHIADFADLCAQRSGHCPYGYGLDDSALDLFLAQGLGQEATVALAPPGNGEIRVAPMAHASNGGAVIDANGETSIPGILACGECATGMHGSNRIGGAMVLATQVFGHRAGERVAWIAQNTSIPSADHDGKMHTDEVEREDGLTWLAQGLSRYAVLGGRPGHEAFAAELRQRLAKARDWRLSLSLETGLGIATSLPC